ncbi:hypothetical protein [uncultured Anaeromusa sp.]|uniref:hypothetical protein n=1 Tax=uncultured Anaeromusa sp. TaxID=673273 RepID=UPI0029C5FE10|nr:hypothetical protein [uncultured Anaeromusa sp.]
MLLDVTQLSWKSAAYPFRGPDSPDEPEEEMECCHDCGAPTNEGNLRYGPGLDLHKYCKDCWEYNFAGKEDDE